MYDHFKAIILMHICKIVLGRAGGSKCDMEIRRYDQSYSSWLRPRMIHFEKPAPNYETDLATDDAHIFPFLMGTETTLQVMV